MTKTTIPAKLLEQARAHGSMPAVVSDEMTLDWARLADLSLRASTYLKERNVGKGDRVAVLCSNRPAFLVAWFGVANTGAIMVSINTGLVGEGLRYTIEKAGCRTLIVERAILDEKRADLEPVLAGVDLIAFDSEADLFELLSRSEPDQVLEGTGTEPVSIIYTSGTTGPPKGVLNCHLAFLSSGEAMARSLRISRSDRIMVFLPLFHTNPQMYAVMSALETGCAVVLRPKFSVSSFFSDARRFECTIFTYVGTVLAMLTSRVTGPERDHSLTRCVGGGCPRGVWREMRERFGIEPFELYGMTEIGGWVTGNAVEDTRFGSCGKTRDGIEVRIVDEFDVPVAPGERGEIVVRPTDPFTILLGYWGNAEATVEATRNLWFHTGDIGSMDEDGYLFFLGRLKEIIRRGGENISPAELEAAILTHPDIKDAAVVGVPDPIFGEEIKAVLVAPSDFDLAEVRRHLSGRVADFMLPRYVQAISHIPRTETEKIRRHELQDNGRDVVDLLAAKSASRPA